MVYVYKKAIGGKDYFYLRASLKKGNKAVTKDIAYLGSSPEEVKANIQKLPQKYEKGIRKAYYRISSLLERNTFLRKAKQLKLREDEFIGKGLVEEVEACRLHYETFLKCHEKNKEETYRNFAIEFSFNTTSIEGNTITLNQAAKLINENLTPKNKEPREIFDVQNTTSVFLWLLQEQPELTHETIQKIHEGLVKNIDTRTGYRNFDVRVFRSHFDSTPGEYVKADTGILLDFYNKHKGRMHPLSLAAIFHHKFEKIHPFADGNGRTGRMLLNLILLKQGYPPLIIAKKQRGDYLDALSACDKVHLDKIGPQYKGLAGFAALEMTRGYWNVFL